MPIDVLTEKINSLKEKVNQLNEVDMDEKTIIQSQITIIEECEKIIQDDDLMSTYDFSNIIKILETYDFSINNLKNIINDIQNVLLIRKELSMSDRDIPFEQAQLNTLSLFKEKIAEIKEKLYKKLNQVKDNKDIKNKIVNLELLRKIFDGTGRRKYYTEEMFKDFFEEFDILNCDEEEAIRLLELFYNTRNFKNSNNSTKVNFNDIVDLYRNFLSPKSMVYFEKMLIEYKDEIVRTIDLDNTREILQFFKDVQILDKFKRTALLKISLYGKLEYIKDTIYPYVMSKTVEGREAFFKDDLASIWIKESSSFSKTPFRTSRGKRKKKKGKLYSESHSVSKDEFEENIKILAENNYLFDYKIDINDDGANLNIKTLKTWVLKNNIELCKLFRLGTISPLQLSCIEKGDIEDKIHLAIELGLLNPPLTPFFLQVDKDIVRNDEFQRNNYRKKRYNQSIRNYFQRYLSVLSSKTINEYSYLFYMLQNEGYIGFYNDFFSDIHAGKGNPLAIPIDGDKLNNKQVMDDFILENFMNDWYSDYINNYDEYNEIITEYNMEGKKEKYNNYSYIDSSILEDPLIIELELNNTVNDIIMQDGNKIERKNEFVYLFDNRIISRYKVLHNASILKEMYGTLNRDMLMTSIVRNSFLDEKTFNNIKSIIMERGRKI